MEIKLTNQEFVDRYNVMNSINVKGGTFNYHLASILEVLEAQVNLVQKAYVKPVGIDAYHQKKDAILKTYGTPTRPTPQGMEYSISLENQEEYNKKIAELDSNYTDLIAENDRRLAEQKIVLDKEETLEFKHLLSLPLPEELSTTEVKALRVFIDEEE